MIFNLPNFVSFLRFPLAFLFLLDSNPALRFFAILTAMISDGLDGYLARRRPYKNKFGTILDPIADKFFVMTVALTFISEAKLEIWQVVALGCRDISVLLYGIYLVLTKKLLNYEFKAILCGKITTFLQFIVLIALALNFEIPSSFYYVFFVLGVFSLGELSFYSNLLKTKNS